MAYQQVREILQSVRRFHSQLRSDAEIAFGHTGDPRSKYLLASLARSEREMDGALEEFGETGEPSVLETWIQYIPDDELQTTILEHKLPAGAAPAEVLEWRRGIDLSLAEFYRQLANQVSASRVKELFESLAGMAEQRLADEAWKSRDDDMASG